MMINLLLHSDYKTSALNQLSIHTYNIQSRSQSRLWLAPNESAPNEEIFNIDDDLNFGCNCVGTGRFWKAAARESNPSVVIKSQTISSLY